MKTLAFVETTAAGEDETTKKIFRGAVLEVNNSLVIPMKILELRTELFIKNGVEYIKYLVDVEDCADEKEWNFAVGCFIKGFNTKAQLLRAGKR